MHSAGLQIYRLRSNKWQMLQNCRIARYLNIWQIEIYHMHQHSTLMMLIHLFFSQGTLYTGVDLEGQHTMDLTVAI